MGEPPTNVRSLHGLPVAQPGAPVPEVVELLRELLARAESGEITALAVAMVKSRGIASLWTTEGTELEGRRFALLAAASKLNFEMNAAVSGVSE